MYVSLGNLVSQSDMSMGKQVNESFGRYIWQARRKKGLSQRELAATVGVDYTYLSKLENDHVEPSEKVIRSLADHLELNAEELMYLAGKMTQRDSEALEEFVKANYKEMPALFRRVRENPGIDSLVKARDEQIARLQRENAELKAKIVEIERQLEEERKAAQEKLALIEKLTLLNEAQHKLSVALDILSVEASRNQEEKWNLLLPYRFYTKEEIEHRANEILMRMQAESYPLRWSFIADQVAEFLGLSIYYDKLLPDDKGPIAAMIRPLERQIVINEDVIELGKGFKQSYIAHQIGHWVLHISQDVANGVIRQPDPFLDIKTTAKEFLSRSVGEQLNDSSVISQLDKIELQAQYFASCLLMPRYILEEKRRRCDLSSWRHLYAMRDELGVTISNLTHRLQDLGWIYIPKGSKQIYLGKALPNE
jgi:transcriptional regulator with XRE-family HTH domain